MTSLTEARPAEQTEQAAPPRWLTQAWLEPRLVVVTLVAIVLSLLAERLEAPALLILLINLTAYAAGGIYGLKGALKSLSERKLDVDLLMILAAVGAALVDQWHEGALLLFLFSLSNVLQDYAIGRSRQAIKSLMKLYPSEAKVKRSGETVTIQISAIRPGDIILIEPGERIPVDGLVRAGRSAIDQSPITGESMPVEKTVGDKVFAGTLNQAGALDVEAHGAAADTVLARIIKLVEEAQDTKAPTERFLDRFEQIYATLILGGIALFIVIPPLLFNVDFQSNFYRAMVLMTVASPCALVISTPASFISAIAAAARNGVLFKGGAYLEGLAEVKVIAFDKTGTLTRGKPAVTDVFSCCELCENDLLATAAAVEMRSEHPLAQAIVNAARTRNMEIPEVSNFEALAGRGIVATVNGQQVHVGSIPYLRSVSPMPERLQVDYTRMESTGKTIIGVIRTGQCEGCGKCDQGGNWMGLLALADEVRPESRQIIEQLHSMGLKVAMLTGDNSRVASLIAEQVGIDRVYADLMPEDKVNVVRQIEGEIGAVAMVGDGVNDAPALATADLGVAMGAAGTDVALETADLVLMGDRLELIPFAIRLSKKARRVVWQNIAFAIGVIIMLILGAFLIDLPLPLGVLGHEGSTVIVVLNGLLSLLIVPEIMRRRNRQVG
ncbi:MAG: cadmium-translocating P-type ATPase [Chloroflexi bacterium]|nr:cadmium-translocating P-type ATPase [Chloroflexota bacterium]